MRPAPRAPSVGGMNTFDYVIVGAGMAGAAAVEGIRAEDPTGTIALIGAEADPPYNRTTLSKALWRDPETTTTTSILLPAAGAPGVTTILGTRVVALDVEAHTVTTDDGRTIAYRRLVLTTGGHARTGGISASRRVIHFHDLADYRALRVLADAGAHVVVVGGGFIGTELAAVLAASPATVTFVFPGAHVDGHVAPGEIAAHLDEIYRSHGVTLVPDTRVSGVREDEGGVVVTFEGGGEVSADAVVMGLGQEPDVALAVAAGLTVDGGIVVDDHGRTSAADVFAAGDAVVHPDRVFGPRMTPHEDAAVTGGRVAGRNAAGADVADDHVPFFYSDLFEDGYEALGRTDPLGRVVVDWKEPGAAAVVYFLDDESVLQGVLMWNVWGDDDHDTKAIAATLLEDRSPRSEADLVGAI